MSQSSSGQRADLSPPPLFDSPVREDRPRRTSFASTSQSVMQSESARSGVTDIPALSNMPQVAVSGTRTAEDVQAVRTIQQQLMTEGDQIIQRESAIQHIRDQLAREGDLINDMYGSAPTHGNRPRPVISSVDVHVNNNAISVNVQATVSHNDAPDVIDLTQERTPRRPSTVVDLTHEEVYPLHRTANVIDLTAVETVTDDDDDDDDNNDGAIEGSDDEDKDDVEVAMETATGGGVGTNCSVAGPSTSVTSEDEGCPICFEDWSNSGDHRLVSLKCGHLFGQSCIEKWLKSSKKCPQCNAKTKKTDIRLIYAKTLKVLDTVERDQALKALESEKEARNKSELEAADLRMKYQMIVEEHRRLKEELQRQAQQQQISSALQSSQGSSSGMYTSVAGSKVSTSGSYVKVDDIVVSKDGQCRVHSYSPALCQLVVAVPFNSTLFKNNFGIKKISTLDFRNIQHVSIHKKPIRDMAFKPSSEDGLLLSVSLDKTVKVTSLMTNTVVQTWDAPGPMWTCCWDSGNTNYFYTGVANGSIIQYDVRDTSKSVREFNNNCTKPVVSLCYLRPSQHFRCSGLMVGQMDEMTFYETLGNYFRLHKLPVSGNRGSLISLCHDVNTSQLLATYRPNPGATKPAVAHQVFKLVFSHPNDLSTVTTMSNRLFLGGTTMQKMSRSCLVNHSHCGLLACVGDEAAQAVHIWNVNSGRLDQSLKSADTVVDVCAFECNSVNFLTALTEKQLSMYKWQASN